MNLLLLAEIANAFSVLATNPIFGSKASEVSAIAGLVGLAFQAAGMTDTDRKELLEQVRDANESGRGSLTDEQAAAWASRHEIAKSIIQSWKPESP